MFQKVVLTIKRIISGYGMLLALIVIGLTFVLPFVITIVAGLGMLPVGMLPLSHDKMRNIVLWAVALTQLIALPWLWFPFPRFEVSLASLNTKLLHSKSWLWLRFMGILMAFPLFAFILSPWALMTLGIEEISYHFFRTSIMSVPGYRMIIFMVGFIWLMVIIGQLCPPAGAISRIVLRCRMVFIDWILMPYKPRAALEEKERLYRCEQRAND